MFFFFLQNVQPNFLLLMVVFLLFSFVKFHFCHISSEVFLLLYFFFIHMASVALLGAHLALSGYVCTSGGWYFAKKEWYQCNQLYPWSTSSFFLVSFICKRKLLLPYYQTIVVWQFALNSLSFICRTLQMIYSCYLMHLRITSSAC